MSALTPTTIAKVTVSTGGTAVQLSSTELLCTAAVIQAVATNNGNVQIGSSNVDNINDTDTGISLAAGETFVLSNQLMYGTNIQFDLSDWYVNADGDGDGVSITYLTNSRTPNI